MAMPQAVLTVVPGRQIDMLDAAGLATQLKDEGRIYDWRVAGSPRGISVILNTNTTSAERLEIAGEFKALGYNVIEVP
jgi:hypothetical protein